MKVFESKITYISIIKNKLKTLQLNIYYYEYAYIAFTTTFLNIKMILREFSFPFTLNGYFILLKCYKLS